MMRKSPATAAKDSRKAGSLSTTMASQSGRCTFSASEMMVASKASPSVSPATTKVTRPAAPGCANTGGLFVVYESSTRTSITCRAHDTTTQKRQKKKQTKNTTTKPNTTNNTPTTNKQNRHTQPNTTDCAM